MCTARMEALSHRGRDPRRQHALPRRRRRRATTPSGASTSARSARRQVLGKLRKLLGRRARRGYDRSLEIGAGTGYFSLNLLQAGVVARGHLHRHLARDGRDAGAPTPQRLGLDVRTARADAESLPFADQSFDLVLGHAVLHHLPNLDRAFAEFHRVLRPGRPDRVRRRAVAASATASPRCPSAARPRSRPLWRRLLRRRARRRRRRLQIGRRTATTTSSSGASTSTRSRPATSSATPRRAGLRRRHGPRRGADRQLVRLVQPRAGGDAPTPTTCRCCGASTPSTATCCCSGSTSSVLEPLLPPAIFYNLLLTARTP